jgi:class 3 adenylate cyclase/tetratricopeptide (TPR) repeat protein
LADFGLAQADDGEHLTATGTLVGTPAYLAPEQAAPELGPVGPWSDQYSLGVVLYHLLTGRTPFEGSVLALIYQIGSKAVPPPSQQRADLEPALERLLLKALARQPRDRFAGVADFAAALRAWKKRPSAQMRSRTCDAEQRRLTLVQCGCDLFESEAILQTLDPEEQHALLLEFQQLCRDVATESAGTVVKATDRGLVFCFGFPVALEDAARRAVRAGLHLLDRMAGFNQRLRQRQDVHLSVRIGVHGGLAIVEDKGGQGEALSIVGPVLSVVDQLEHLAPPDAVVISDDIHRLVQGFFECPSLGEHKLRGAAGARPIYRVHRALAASDRVEAAGAVALTPFHGNDGEVALLQVRWNLTADGLDQTVVLLNKDAVLEFQQLCREVAAKFEGAIVKESAHTLLACFGHPVVRDCAAQRAVRAGLHLVERMTALNEHLQRRDVYLSARIAIHGGVAAIQDSSGSGELLSVVASLLPVVDSLEHRAIPDAVVISDAVHQKVSGFFEFTSLGPQKLRGAATAQPIYCVHRELAAGDSGEVARRAGLTALVGRDREVALLQERWEQAAEGMGQVVLLAGEAGIGKSRLIHVLKEYVAGQRTPERQALIIEWPCVPENERSHLHAIASFEKILGLEPHDRPAQKLDGLAAHLENLHLASAEAVALLASLLLIPLDDRYPLPGLSPQRQKEKTLDLLLDWLRALAQRQPVLLVIEDLHWSGSMRLEFLQILVGQAQDARLLTLLTYRPEFVPPWKTKAHHTQVFLNRLTRRQTCELMVARSGLPRIPQAVLDRVADQTDGVPLFVEEYTAMLLEAGALRVSGGEVQVSDAFDVHAIPATLQDLLMARLDRMASKLDVVQLAAALGREFSYEVLSAVASCSEESLQQELAKLVEAELLFQHGRPPRARYQFKHALIRDAAYQSLLRTRRQQFHLRIAEVIEQRFPEICAAQPELLAHHFAEGNALFKAVMYWERAGERSQQRGGAVEGIGYLKRGLELIQALPETRERYAQEIQMHISLGVACAAAKGFGVAELEAIYARAHALCLQTGMTAQAFPALFGRLRYSINQSRHAYAQELAEELLALAKRENNIGFLVAAHAGLGTTLFLQGKHTEAIQHLEKVILIEATPELRATLHRYVVIDLWVSSEMFLSWILCLMGYPERAAQHNRRALSIAEDMAHPFSHAFALGCGASWLYHFVREYQGTRATVTRALALGKEIGFAGVVAWATILSGWTLTEQGQSEQALVLIRQGLDDLLVQEALGDRNELLTVLVEAYALADKPEKGLETLAEARQFVEATGERFGQAEILRLQGELLIQHDPAKTPDAEVCLQQALEVARHQQARSLELRAAMSLGRLWHQQGKTLAAHELVAGVYGAFTEGWQTHDLKTARLLLDQWQSPGS